MFALYRTFMLYVVQTICLILFKANKSYAATAIANILAPCT